MPKRVAVLGAGVCGLVATKCCLDEGLLPVCFEKTDRIGGLWNYRANREDGVACVMKSTICNTSKEMSCLSDFPVPTDFPNFMPHGKMLEYLKLYSQHFNVENYIKYHHCVTNIRKTADFAATGEWLVEYKDLGSTEGDTVTERFHAVMVCSGHFADKYIPVFPGAEDFQGTPLHSLDYTDPAGYDDKRVIVVGLGNSGGDIAVELSRTAKQVYLSTRRGSWVTQRTSFNGIPIDLTFQRRVLDIFRRILGHRLLNKILRKQVNDAFDHNMYGLEPEHEPLSYRPVVNDELPDRVLCGLIQVKPNIQRITKSGVIFEDGTQVDADVIIYATGYSFGFPFLEQGIIECTDKGASLYHFVFPPDLCPASLAVIGCCTVWGSVIPVAELQARWASRVFKDLARLPSSDVMWRVERARRVAIARRYIYSRYALETDFIPYMDELARQIGVKPNLWKLLLSDRALWLKVMFGPATPFQYRLMGPGSWPGARQAIMTLWDRVYQPLKTRKVPARTSKSYLQKGMLLITISSVLYSAYSLFKYFCISLTQRIELL